MGRTQAEPEVVESAKRDDLSSLDGSEPAKAAAQGDSPEARADTWLRRHQLILYFALAYAISWPFRLLSRLAGGTLGTVLIVIGAFGPPIAAAITIRYSGGSLIEWLRRIVRWRAPVGCYAYALGLPILIMGVMNATLAALGRHPDLSLLPPRVPAYLQTLLLTALIFGGQEEPGWRGFALPRLEPPYSGDSAD
jgi:hypothetical protein